MRLIVADAGPLIALSRIRRLAILPLLFDEVVVPAQVLAELRLEESRPGVADLKRAVERERWLRARKPRGGAPAIPGLDAGESAAIRLAAMLACPLLVDERRARIVAAKRGVAVVGIGRILIEAQRRGLLESVDAELTALRNAGYRLSDALCRQLLSLAGSAESQA